jgi:hypothetical protein
MFELSPHKRFSVEFLEKTVSASVAEKDFGAYRAGANVWLPGALDSYGWTPIIALVGCLVYIRKATLLVYWVSAGID